MMIYMVKGVDDFKKLLIIIPEKFSIKYTDIKSRKWRTEEWRCKKI